MRKNQGKYQKSIMIISLIFVGTLLILSGILLNSYSLQESIKSISFMSENANYENKEAGSWKVEKSAKWIAQNQVQITFDVDTISKAKYQNTDIILVMDISVSMTGNKLNKAKNDAIELARKLLSIEGNKMSLISFESSSDIKTDFTDNLELIETEIDKLMFNGKSNYYQALLNVGNLLETYTPMDNHDCIVLFLTGSFPSIDLPNESGYFNYLKDNYPFITINAVQYGMGNDILDPVKKISDNQYLVNLESDNNVLFDAASAAVPYSEFSLTDYIDTKYFEVESSNDITVSQGAFNFDKSNQSIHWSIYNLISGSKVRMTIQAKLKDQYLGQAGFYSTNTKEELKTRLDESIEDVTSTKTPILSNNYQVIYEDNAPNGCTVKNMPAGGNYFVLDQVEISNKIPVCEGYIFNGWKVIGTDANQISEDYFIMPEDDVVLKAEWKQLSFSKSMDGEIYVAPTAILQVADKTGTSKIWKYKDSVTKVVFQDGFYDVYNVLESFDVSAEENQSVLAFVSPNVEDQTTYTVYIQGENGIVANENSSYLFNEFFRLETIEGLEYLDTSNVTDMSYMFGWCENLKTIDVSHFNTSKVTTMLNMFRDNLNLTSLDLSHFDTRNVTTMQWMLGGTSKLQEINLSSFDTSKVTDMTAMFAGTGAINLDFSSFDTSNVTTMRVMFSNANYLKTINVSSFNTEKVTNMSNMFNNCYELESLDISNFNTKNVTTMAGMFFDCNKLTTLNINPDTFDTSLVTSMQNMFHKCSSLTSLDVSKFNTAKVKDMQGMFSYCRSLKTLDTSNFNTINVTTMLNMFWNCNNLKNLNLSSFNTIKVNNMQGMFSDCISLEALDLNSFDTSNVTTMYKMFNECQSLTLLNVSSFNTAKVTDMYKMFSNCGNITTLDVSRFNTAKVTNMGCMFYNCSKVTILDVSNFNTTLNKTMESMFLNCGSITTLNVSGFNTANVTNMYSAFKGCEKVTVLDVSHFDTSKVTTMYSMFDRCKSINTLNVKNFNTSNVTTMAFMFKECQNITSLDLSSFNTSEVTSMIEMFYNDINLVNLDVSSFNTSNVTTMQSMFSSCTNLGNINISNFDTSKVTSLNYMFSNSKNISATITIRCPNATYQGMFYLTSSTSGSITVNYNSAAATVIDQMIGTKSSSANVIKGVLVA